MTRIPRSFQVAIRMALVGAFFGLLFDPFLFAGTVLFELSIVSGVFTEVQTLIIFYAHPPLLGLLSGFLFGIYLSFNLKKINSNISK